MSNKTTESVASIFQANAEYLEHLEWEPPKARGLYEQSFENNLWQLDGTSSILLLDLWDEEEYKLSHIKGALNYPGPNIARDKFLPIMNTYKNKEGKIIVVYNNDER